MAVRGFFDDFKRVRQRRKGWEAYVEAARREGKDAPSLTEALPVVSSAVSTPASSRSDQPPTPVGSLWTAVLSFLALIGSVGALVMLDRLAGTRDLFITLPIQIVLGSIGFLAGVTFVVVAFAGLGLQSREHALALPEGSVRALIALILIVIFFIFANTVFGIFQRGEARSFVGLTATQVDALPGEVLSQTPAGVNNDGVQVFNGEFERSVNDNAVALGQQLVTALITLVAAISAFYFGSNSVKSATEAATRAAAVSGGVPASIVPNVTGRPRESALKVLAGEGFSATVTKKPHEAVPDEVIAQNPSGGVSAPRTEPVDLVVSSGTETPPRGADGEDGADG